MRWSSPSCHGRSESYQTSNPSPWKTNMGDGCKLLPPVMFTLPKFNIDTQNSHIYLKGDTFSKITIFGIYVKFRGCKREILSLKLIGHLNHSNPYFSGVNSLLVLGSRVHLSFLAVVPFSWQHLKQDSRVFRVFQVVENPPRPDDNKPSTYVIQWREPEIHEEKFSLRKHWAVGMR